MAAILSACACVQHPTQTTDGAAPLNVFSKCLNGFAHTHTHMNTIA